MPVILNNQYILGRTLGQGASCKVKLAKDADERRFAIKILNSESEEIGDVLKNELETLS